MNQIKKLETEINKYIIYCKRRLENRNEPLRNLCFKTREKNGMNRGKTTQE